MAKNGTLLWIDDEIELLRAHILFLKGKDYEVDTATNGRDALDRCRERSYDLILLDGKHFTPIDIYALYVERTCQTIKILFPMAKIIFATSTPVREEMFTGACKRYNQDTEKYNQVAVEIVKRYGGEINDLYSLAKASPVEWHSDLTHYYTKEGTRMLTEQVVWHIEQSLGIQGKTLDYDALFADTNDIVGI